MASKPSLRSLDSQHTIARLQEQNTLESHGIIPSSQTKYQLQDIKKALFEMTHVEGSVKVYCMRDTKVETWLLTDVRICLNKYLEPMKCPKVNYYRRRRRVPTLSQPLPSPQPCPADGIIYLKQGQLSKGKHIKKPFIKKISRLEPEQMPVATHITNTFSKTREPPMTSVYYTVILLIVF
ncbi:unnamed protein product [Enterobius vermicularis]|uniref:Ral guanine nucleotide dissociation stimulator-like 1 n=1 Tax=Enterobius vermicularis TaxID=51028 RepID=A0A0N4V9Y0_ENTVE|nr:unnamed protein product [Enterobius vermicularis]